MTEGKFLTSNIDSGDSLNNFSAFSFLMPFKIGMRLSNYNHIDRKATIK